MPMALPYLTGLSSHVGIPYYMPPPNASGTMNSLPPDQGNEPHDRPDRYEGSVSRKRKRPPTPIQSEDTSSSESDEEVDMDPDHYYQSTPKKMPKVVDEFMTKTFQRCIPKKTRLELAKQYPKPSCEAALVPKLDHDIKGALGKDIPERDDTKLAKIQATVLASAAPLTNFWAHLLEMGASSEEQIPAGEVVQVMKDSLALIGNASNYMSQTRRSNIIQSLSKSRPKLGSFMKDVCNDNLSNTRGELFGPDIRKKITDRASTIEAFNKAITTVDKPTKSGTSNSRFLSKRPNASYGGRSGKFQYTPYNKFRSQKGQWKPKKSPLPLKFNPEQKH